MQSTINIDTYKNEKSNINRYIYNFSDFVMTKPGICLIKRKNKG